MNPNETKSPNLVGTTPTTRIEAGSIVPITDTVTSRPITSDILSSTTPVQVPSTQTSTISQGLSGVVDGVKTSAQQALDQQNQAQLEATKSKESSSANDLKSIVEQQLGIATDRANLETEAKLAEKSQAVTNVTNQIEASQRAQTNELRALQEDKFLTPGQLAGRTQEINRKYAFEQADLALIQSAANRDYATAQNIVDRKIQLQLEPLKLKYDYYKEINAGDKSAYTEAQKNQLSNLETQASREYSTSQQNAKSIQDLRDKAIDSRQPELLKELSSIDPSSKTFQSDLNNVASKIQKASDPIFKTLADGRDVMLDKQGNIIKVISGAPLTKEQKDTLISQQKAKEQIPAIQDKITQIDSTIKSLDTNLLGRSEARGAVGPNPIARTNLSSFITGSTQNFIATVEQVISSDTLITLTDLKAAGGTLGALSEKELQILQSTASKIGSWRITDDTGKVTGYNTTEANMQTELKKLKMLSERALLKASGTDLTNEEFLKIIPTAPAVDNNSYFNSY